MKRFFLSRDLNIVLCTICENMCTNRCELKVAKFNFNVNIPFKQLNCEAYIVHNGLNKLYCIINIGKRAYIKRGRISVASPIDIYETRLFSLIIYDHWFTRDRLTPTAPHVTLQFSLKITIHRNTRR